MFTKQELELFKALLNSDINLPIKMSGLVVEAKNKLEDELKKLDETKSE